MQPRACSSSERVWSSRAVASTCNEALGQAEALQPDVVLVDISLGKESGFDLARRLAEDDQRNRAVVLISTHDESDFTDLITESPAVGFLPKAELSASEIRRIVASERRENEDRRLRELLADHAGSIETLARVAGRHADVDDREVGSMLAHERDQFGGVATLADDLEAPPACGSRSDERLWARSFRRASGLAHCS